ncbi:helix-turn-helix domain-containing protein [Streptomyces sp. NPDC086549]|uniref:helix-turn-helix domain-containing protein n=1 Tax=Streptomyces sp. NPDC086549 TaxID=3365752 RepID=UPI00381A0A36
MAERAQIILACADGMSNAGAAQAVGAGVKTVRKWRGTCAPSPESEQRPLTRRQNTEQQKALLPDVPEDGVRTERTSRHSCAAGPRIGQRGFGHIGDSSDF